jgi:hypothetical protein
MHIDMELYILTIIFSSFLFLLFPFFFSAMLRCFHRTFLCTSPSPEARAKSWPMTVLHDCLYIGAGKQNSTTSSSSSVSASSISAPVTPQHLHHQSITSPPQQIKLSPNDQQLIMTLCQATGVDTQTATQLLMQSQGDIDRAIAIARGHAQ